MFAVREPAKFAAAVQQNHKAVIRVDVCNAAGSVLQSLIGGPSADAVITGGNVDIDETRQVRRILNLTVESQGRQLDNLIPRVAGDLLHPASMNELKVYRGIDYQDGSEPDMCPLGVFRISKPKVKKSPSGTYELTITGQDRSAWISRLVWQNPYEVTAGTELSVALFNAINSIVPGLTYNMPTTTYDMPDTIWGLDITTGSNDPWADFIAAAGTGSYQLLFDPSGLVTLAPTVNPVGLGVSATFTEGQNCTMTELGELIDETVEYNGVIVISNPPGSTAPVQGAAWITDPASPVYYLGPWGQVPYVIKTTTAVDAPGCVAMAEAQLQLIYRAMDTIDFSCVPDPRLQEGDVVTVGSPGMGVQDNYVYSASIVPLDWNTPQTVTCRSQVNPNG